MSEENKNETPESQETDEVTEEFDAERAMKTIKAQREAEAKAKADLASVMEKLAKYEEAEQAEAEKNKSLETKLVESQSRIDELQGKILESAVRADFMQKASERGYEEPHLAFLAAKEQGVLGEVNPETGEVGDHNFETLEEKYPSLADEAEGSGGFFSNDGGVRGGKPGKKPDQVFNDLIRSVL